MTPQSSFMVLAPVDPLREAELRRLLDSMNDAPGRLKKPCPLVPFHDFETLHVARLFLVDDKTTGDVAVYGIPKRRYPLYLAFLGRMAPAKGAHLAIDVAHAPAHAEPQHSARHDQVHLVTGGPEPLVDRAEQVAEDPSRTVFR